MPGAQLEADVVGTTHRLARALEAAAIPYAVGGAIALTMHGFVRATRDVDINVFCDEAGVGRLVDVLAASGLSVDATRAAAEAASEGWFTAWDGAVRVDVFVPSIDYAWEALRSRVQRSFVGQPVWFLSAEALCVFKLLFFRTKDLADLEQLLLTSDVLDRSLVRSTIAGMMGDGDPRVVAWDSLTSRFSPPPR